MNIHNVVQLQQLQSRARGRLTSQSITTDNTNTTTPKGYIHSSVSALVHQAAALKGSSSIDMISGGSDVHLLANNNNSNKQSSKSINKHIPEFPSVLTHHEEFDDDDEDSDESKGSISQIDDNSLEK